MLGDAKPKPLVSEGSVLSVIQTDNTPALK